MQTILDSSDCSPCPLWWLSPCLLSSSHTGTYITRLKTWEKPSAELWRSLCQVLFSPFSSLLSCTPALCIPLALVSQSFHTCLFSSGSLSFPSLVVAWNFIPGVSGASRSTHLICSTYFRDQCPILLVVQCLKNIVSHIFSSFFRYLTWEGKSSPCYSM